MKKIEFLKGKLNVNGYEFIVRNGSLGDRYTESELEELNNLTIEGIANIPHSQKTLLVGEFSPSPNELWSVMQGNAKFTCLTNDGRSLDYDLQLFGELNGSVLASQV